ncbi:MAG: TonB-dependent receptor [Bacteroidaceae bacterium]|nr:TonB-dependent receptor [Bacteroidaceae bacterium]
MRTFRIFKSCFAGCVIFILSLCDVFAQNDDAHILDSLVVTNERNSVKLNASPLQYLSSADLERIGATDAGDALKHLSGVTVKDYGGVGGMKTVAVRGLGAQHTAVIYDGVAVGDCQSGQVDLGRFSVDNLDGLQLTIGQSDDIYTSARALASAGVVSLQTRTAADRSFRAIARVASYDYYNVNMLLAQPIGRNCRFSLFTDYMNAGGRYGFKLKHVSGKRNNSDVESVRGEADFTWTPSGRHTLRAKVYGYSSSRGVPGAVIVDNPLSSERLVSRNLFGQLFYEYVPLATFKMKAALKHNFSYDKSSQPRAAGSVVHYRYRQHETDFSYTVKYSPAFIRGLSFAFSEEMFHNRLSTDNNHVTMPSRPERLTSLSAVSSRYVSEYISFTASLLYTYAAEWAPKGSAAPDRSRFSPSFSFSVSPFGNALLLRMSYKDIFRMPTFNDLYYREIGNYTLRPEKSRMFNVGVVGDIASVGCLKRLSVSADAYWGRVTDKIVAVPGVFIWKMSNVDRVALSGVDMSVSADVQPLPFAQMRIDATYNYMRAVNDKDGSTLKGDQIIYTPRHSGSFSVVFYTKPVDCGYSLVWSGKRYRMAQNIPSNEVDGYMDHSIWLSRSWNVWGVSFTGKFEAVNIADDNYEIISYYPMQGRSFRLSLKMNI